MDGTELSKAGNHTARPVIGVDVARYQAMLDASNASDAQKEEFLQQLWQVVVAFVELGYRVDPVHLACGKDDDIAAKFPAASQDMLGWEHTLTKLFEESAAHAAKDDSDEGSV